MFGYFALTFFTPDAPAATSFGIDVPIFNALSAGIIIGFLVLPTIASISEDAMSAVPQSLREGAFGLGAAKLQVALRVVFPAALSGIVAVDRARRSRARSARRWSCWSPPAAASLNLGARTRASR